MHVVTSCSNERETAAMVLLHCSVMYVAKLCKGKREIDEVVAAVDWVVALSSPILDQMTRKILLVLSHLLLKRRVLNELYLSVTWACGLCSNCCPKCVPWVLVGVYGCTLTSNLQTLDLERVMESNCR